MSLFFPFLYNIQMTLAFLAWRWHLKCRNCLVFLSGESTKATSKEPAHIYKFLGYEKLSTRLQHLKWTALMYLQFLRVGEILFYIYSTLILKPCQEYSLTFNSIHSCTNTCSKSSQKYFRVILENLQDKLNETHCWACYSWQNHIMNEEEECIGTSIPFSLYHSGVCLSPPEPTHVWKP